MSEPVKVGDQAKEGEQLPNKVVAKASAENFTDEKQAAPTEKFTTWSSEEPKKVLVAARPGETLEEFTVRTRQYHEELEQKAKQKPTIPPFSIGGFEDGSEVTAGGKQKPAENLEPPARKNNVSPEKVCVDPRPSYVEGLKAIGNDEEAQGKYSIAYIERKAKESQGAGVVDIEAEPVLLAHERREKLKLEGYVSEPENPFQSFKNLTRKQQNEVIEVLEKASRIGQESLNQQANDVLTGEFVMDFIRSIDLYVRSNLGSATWKEAIALTCQNLQKVAHGEKIGVQEPLDKAATLVAGVLMKTAQDIDQIGQHAHPRAFVEDTHAAAETMRAGIDTANDYYANKIQSSDLGSIPADTVDATHYAKERAAKAIEDFPGNDVSEQSSALGMAATIVFLMAATRELFTPAKAREMGLLSLTEEELEAQGIQKKHIKDVKQEDIVNPIDRTASTEVKIAQLQALSRENEPLVRAFMKQLDDKFGSVSELDHKTPQQILDKATRPKIKEFKPWFEIEHVRDSLRFRTPVDNLNDLPEIAKMLKGSGFEIINPDVDRLLHPKNGWRMAVFDLRAPNGQIFEFQVVPNEMNEAGKLTHGSYKGTRGLAVADLSFEQRRAMDKAELQTRRTHEAAWKAYLARTKQSDTEIRRLVERTTEVTNDN